MALDFFAGCAGGVAGVIVGHPLDTVKVRLQTQSPTNIKYRGTFHCLTTTIKQESVRGLYKGISSPLLGVAGVNALIFGVYGSLRPYVSESPGNDALWAHFAAGSISGAVQSIVASPMELVKTRMQINDDKVGCKKKGPLDVMRGIYQNEGGLRRGIFKGWGITLSREIPGFGFYFASYEAMTRFGNGQIGTLGMMLAGGMAGVISWIVTFPIDVVKTRIQCDDTGKYRGVLDCVRKTYINEGYRAFTRGLTSTVIRAFPTNAATFTVVTWIMRFAEEMPDDTMDSRKYLDQLLNETSQLQEKFEDSLRLKVPQYFYAGSSLTSSSLATQCAAAAQRYSDKTQVYFNFYQSLRQQIKCENQFPNEGSEEEGNDTRASETIVSHNEKTCKHNVKHSQVNRTEKKVFSHEGFSFPVRVISSDVTNEKQSNLGTRRASDIQYLSTRDFTYLSKSLDIPVHILEAAAAMKPQNSRNNSSPTVAKPKDTLQPSVRKVDKSSSIVNAWRKYCAYKSTAFNLCTCFEDHCVCYL